MEYTTVSRSTLRPFPTRIYFRATLHARFRIRRLFPYSYVASRALDHFRLSFPFVLDPDSLTYTDGRRTLLSFPLANPTPVALRPFLLLSVLFRTRDGPSLVPVTVWIRPNSLIRSRHSPGANLLVFSHLTHAFWDLSLRY